MSYSEIHCLLTGASDGIGKEAAFYLASRRLVRTLVLHGRNAEKTAAVAQECTKLTTNNNNNNQEEENGASGDSNSSGKKEAQPPTEIKVVIADLGSLESVAKMAEEVAAATPNLNCLVNNAGVLTKELGFTKEGYELMWGVNAVAPTLLTMKLLPLLEKNKPSRIVHTSSLAHLQYGLSCPQPDPENPGKFIRTGTRRTTLDVAGLNPKTEAEFDWYRQYGVSKLGQVFFSLELAKNKVSDPKAVTSNCFHPGVIETSLKNAGLAHVPGLPTSDGIRVLIHLVTSPDAAAITGAYWDWVDGKATVAPHNPIVDNADEMAKAWEAMLAQAGVKQ